MPLGINIRRRRLELNMTQQDLADHLNCTQACYSHYESGKRDVPAEVLSQLADFYGVSVDYLMGRTNQKTPYPKR